MKKRIASQLLCLMLAAGYLLGIHNGKIALWNGDDPNPIRVFPYSVSKLPEEARKMLEAGIPVESMEQLRQLAETYLS
jgi:hypothetical protein